MARNRLITHLEDTLIADVAEKAAETGNSFDETLEIILVEHFSKDSPVPDKKPAAPKKPAAKKSK